MIDDDKIKTFEKHLGMMEKQQIREFTEFCILRLPEYFWTIKASTSGRTHNQNQTLIQHVQNCLKIGERVIRQMQGVWGPKQNDQLRSALILHDGWRCGEIGKEKTYTNKLISECGYDPRLLGKLRTTSQHPEIGYKCVLKLAAEFNMLAQKNNTLKIGGKVLEPIAKAIRYHYGPWTSADLEKPFSFTWPFESIVIQVHNIDYMETTFTTLGDELC